jgi:Spy/CpxP family protein refolding chaperone
MQRTLSIFIAATLLLTGFTLNAHAGERSPRAKAARPGPGKPMGPLAHLNLTPDQRQKIDQIHKSATKLADPIHEQIAAKMKEMAPLWTVEKPDKAAIERKHSEIAALRTKLWSIHIDTRLKIHALLTPEQRAKWATGPGMEMGPMHGPGGPGMPAGGCPHMQAGECACPHAADCPHKGGGMGAAAPGPGAKKGPGCPYATGGPAKPKPAKP